MFGLEGELLTMGAWSVGLGAIGAAIAGIFLANTDLCLPKVAEAPLEYLENTDLRSTTDGEWAFFIPKILIFLTSAVVKTFRRRISPTKESVSYSFHTWKCLCYLYVQRMLQSSFLKSGTTD